MAHNVCCDSYHAYNMIYIYNTIVPQYSYNSIIDISHVICMVRITAHIVNHLGSEMRTAT